MSRAAVHLVAKLFLLLFLFPALTPGIVLASDGDVDYSAPYITVDPETGELVTVNPGPQMKTHDASSGNGNASGANTTADDTVTAGGDNTSQAPAADAEGSSGTVVPVAVVAVIGLALLSAFAFLRGGQRKTGDA